MHSLVNDITYDLLCGIAQLNSGCKTQSNYHNVVFVLYGTKSNVIACLTWKL